MHRREQQTGDEGEMIDEEAELGLIARPMRWPVEGEGEKQNIDGGKECRFREECAGEEADDEHDLESRRHPGKKKRKWKSRRGDVTGRRLHAGELERRGHDEDKG